MRVALYATLRAAVGTKHVELALPAGSTVWDLVQALVARYPTLGPHLIDPGGHLWRHVHVMVNGRDAPYLDGGLQAALQPDDVLDVFPPVGGG